MATDDPNDDLHLAADEADRLLRLIENTPNNAVHQDDPPHTQSIYPAVTARSTRSGLPISTVVLGSLLTGLFAGAFLLGSLSQRGGSTVSHLLLPPQSHRLPNPWIPARRRPNRSQKLRQECVPFQVMKCQGKLYGLLVEMMLLEMPFPLSLERLGGPLLAQLML